MELNENEKLVQTLYNDVENAWPNNNVWYDYTRGKIIDFITSNINSTYNKKILNAGSGGSTYNLKGDIYHVDLAENLINMFPKHYVATIEKIPFENSFFDIAICVGSVINYNNAFEDIFEISRVLSSNSMFILEYERSFTSELLFKKEYGKGSTIQIYNYNGQRCHKLWLYSDKYINNILFSAGFVIKKEMLFHCISAVYNKMFNDENKAGKFARFDKKIPKSLAKYIAHNRILLCTKKD